MKKANVTANNTPEGNNKFCYYTLVVSTNAGKQVQVDVYKL